MAITFDGSGTVTGISVGGLPDGIVDTDMIAANAVTAAKRGAGAIIQVVEMKKTDTTSINPSTSWADVSGLAITITPTSASNKILLTGMINHSHVGQHIGSRIVRSVGGSDAIPTGWVGDASGSRTQTLTGNWGFSAEANDGNEMLNISIIDDSHNTTSAITYKFQMFEYSSSSEIAYFNRSHNNTDAAYSYLAVSTMIAMEVAA